MLEAMFLLGDPPDVTLFAVSIDFPQPMRCEFGDALASMVGAVAGQVLAEIGATRAGASRAPA